MRSCLHNWSDEDSAKILARIKEAMKPGYSRLLINENVIPPEKAFWEVTSRDVLMLAVFESRERTEEDWKRLVQGVGLRINKIYPVGNESIIECEVADEQGPGTDGLEIPS